MRELDLKISVAMCTYNGDKYLEKQIDSIIMQTIQVDEIIVCDDCSSDGTESILEKYCQRMDCNIRIVKNKNNIGYIKNFERAINLCNGDIVFLCDQDDIWHKDKVERYVEVFKNKLDIGLIFSNAILINQYDQKSKKTLWDIYFKEEYKIKIRNKRIFKELLKKNFITGATVAFRKSYFNEIKYIPNEWVHDHFIALIFSSLTKLYYIEECLTSYRIHDMQQIGLKNSKIKSYVNRMKNGDLINNEIKKIKVLENYFNNIEINDVSEVRQYLKFLQIRENVRGYSLVKRVINIFRNLDIYYTFCKKSIFIDILNI